MVIVIVIVMVIGKNRWRVRINTRRESIYEQLRKAIVIVIVMVMSGRWCSILNTLRG